ncbi:hypothetical protein NIES37_62640 [Tolypothrix tenuis PCC 7101]|uniref:Uncharacterized protein n=1 Tax=Tolypothrix tenuis PCC 7101 TaxID=231146 RepID=A0A1Z4N9B7_9CYAN|nr:hypothetical protein [Aulosira sp. FACHB-113]BAZ02252.1 hypothetical protein NIES37_62640 [Tolypothrix tenuis PCC 7101]BAZ73827.1 hypothetical protein NIES50_23930 [Aulosira laxa NIES-50]
MQVTLQQLFGDGATQNIDTITIKKSDLPGLLAASNNTAESLLVAILLKVLDTFAGKLTDENGNPITDENGVPITFNQGDILDTFYLEYWRTIFKKKGNVNYRIFQFVLHEFEVY